MALCYSCCTTTYIYIRCPRCFFCADRFGVGKVTRKQDGYPVQYKCRRLTSRMMACAGALELAGIVLSFPKTGGKQKTENCRWIRQTRSWNGLAPVKRFRARKRWSYIFSNRTSHAAPTLHIDCCRFSYLLCYCVTYLAQNLTIRQVEMSRFATGHICILRRM